MMKTQTHHTEAGAAFTDLVLEIFRLNGVLLAAGDRLTAPLDLTSARWQVLGTLGSGPLPVPHIARQMGLTRQAVQRTVNILEGEGFITLGDNPHHKTAKLVSLSETGNEKLMQVSQAQALWANEVTKDAGLEAITTALETLRLLRQYVEK